MLEIRVAEAVERGEPGRAIALIDEALASADDYRLREDLLLRRARLLADAGRHAEAAATLGRLAASIIERSGETSPELLPVLSAAVEANETAGRQDEVVALIVRILDILAAAGLHDEADPYLARLDALSASAAPDVAGQAAALAETFRLDAEEIDRGDPFAVDPEQGFTTVKIYYATDRARTGDEAPSTFYGGERGALEMGVATVSLPPRHLPGKIERPSVWSFEFREDPGKHVVLRSVTPGPDDAVFAEMRDHLAGATSDAAFVFVHGFNVPFDKAAQRTAQMAYDMNFDGLPILFSWPSRASLLSYISDTAVVELSGRRLTRFLEDVAEKSGATRIHLIAHSMGNRAMTDALELFALTHRDEPPAFDQVLFTAPDVDAGLFAEVMKTIRPVARRITLYASDEDWALAVSRRLHGDAPRAGQGGENIVHAADVDSIDMTGIGEDMLAHSYYANNPSALTDILALFWRDAPPEDRCGMVQVEGANGDYWEYAPEQCDSNALLTALSYLRSNSAATLAEARAFMNSFVAPAKLDPDERSRLEKALSKLFGKG